MNALQSLHNGTLTGKREQSIYTPQCIVDALLRLWPEGIACDPCPGDLGVSLVNAFLPLDDGLELPVWPRRTYVNPPYDKLKPWIERFERSWECVLLTPVRTHRRWWRTLLLPSSRVCWLNPVKFIGYKQTFPAPLALIYRGDRDFARATEGLGDVL